MSATRLLVLGVMRFMQPVHGYDVRRELLTWQLEELSNVKPGSIYSAIRTLERDGCIAVHSRESEDSRPERTAYVVTHEGEKEFHLLLRQTWWTVKGVSDPLIPGLCLLPYLPRDELVAALQARIGQLNGAVSALAFSRGLIKDGATGEDGAVPEHVREVMDLVAARNRAEVEWTRTLIKRLRGGKYRLSGEGDFPEFGPLDTRVD